MGWLSRQFCALLRARSTRLGSSPDFTRSSQGNGERCVPDQAGIDIGEPGGLVGGQPQEEITTRRKASGGQGDEHLQISDGPHGGKVECRRRGGGSEVFQAFAAHLDLGESTSTSGFLKKGPFLRYRFEEGHRDLGEDNLQSQAGEACAAADVEQVAAKFQVAGEEKAFAEVAGHTLFGVADGREVDFFVPVEEEIKISKRLVNLGEGQLQAKGCE